MPLFILERKFAKKLRCFLDEAAGLNEIKAEDNILWVISFLSVDSKKAFAFYETPDAKAVHQAAERAGIPAGQIIEINEEDISQEVIQSLYRDRIE